MKLNVQNSKLEITLEEGLLGAEKKIAIKGYKGGIKTFTVNVPTGIHDGEKIRLAALGHPGKNGGKNGDLIIDVHITEHPTFKIQGSDLVQEIFVSPATAIIGDKFKTKLFDDTICVDLPKYLKQGEYITSNGNGYVDENGNRGNLLLHVNIQMPDRITEREEKLYEQIAKLERNIFELQDFDSEQKQIEQDINKYENIIDSIDSENRNLNKRIIGLEDSIKMYKYKLDVMNDREKELIESNNHLRTSNKNLLQTTINLSDKTNEK